MPDQKPPSKNRQPQGKEWISLGVGMGLVLGAGIGVAMDNLAVGIGIGLVIGAAVGVALSQRKAQP